MMKNRNIIVFSDDWGRHPSSCQHLVKQLLPYNRVIWVNTIGMRSPQFSLYDLKRSFEVIGSWLQKKSETETCAVPENLMVVSPVMIPYNNISVIRSFNRLSIRHTLRRIMSEKGMSDVVVISTFPCTCDCVGDLDESVYVYYCVDDFVNWPDVDLNLINEMEEKLLQQCDLVLATAEELCKVKTTSNKPTHLLAHGVDFDRFNVCRDQGNAPETMIKITGPIIGFFGALSAWLDFDLLVDLAKERPDWSFVFIGPADTDISPMINIPNVHLLGKVAYEQLPLYAAWFDVGIIPFQVNELTKSVNPLKLLEYLSLGLPVVSTFMPEVLKYSDVVYIAHGKEEFLHALEACLAETGGKRRQLRLEKASNNSWQAVAERFGQLVTATERVKTTCQYTEAEHSDAKTA